ncbi:MAG TPA: type IV-A pilus assembly ATPase PilB [bacterium]|nr:type IV-A pilus assembly ATPase PilB [bacterium]
MTVKTDIVEKLLNLGVLRHDEATAITKQAESNGISFQKALLKIGYMSEERLLEFLVHIYGVEAVNPLAIEIPRNIVKLISPEVAAKFNVLPIDKRGRILSVAMADPSDMLALNDLKFITGLEIVPMVATESALATAIEQHYRAEDNFEDLAKDLGEGDIEVLEDKVEEDQGAEEAEQAPVIKFVNSMIADAVRKHASDIHIEPAEKVFRVRFRIDGTLQEVIKQPAKMKSAIISRLKIMAELDISERRIPQDGRIKIRVDNKTIDIRVSSLPTIFGEKVVLRILDKSNLALDLTRFGFEENALKNFIRAVESPYGMVLVTGPTGSGKTTTLYSALNRINKPDVNIMTAEDPVEYNIDGINQVHINDDIGLSFAKSLRAFLRQDPNIIMVGEIRDSETASIATKAALTGHLVLSTVHTNDAPSTIDRLVDMGVEPFLVAASVNLILAQRLVRKVCQKCKAPVEVHGEALRELGISPEDAKNMVFYKGRGCPGCNNTGYSGRQGLYEVMPISQVLRRMILDRGSVEQIKRQAMSEGMLTLRQDALLKLKAGSTSVEEVLRETATDE